MDLRKRYALDVAAETAGVWHDLDGGARIKVARLGTPAYAAALAKAKAEYGDRKLTDDEGMDAINQAMASAVLVDWQGVTEGDAEVPYSIDAAYAYLSDPAMREFSNMVFGLAADAENFRAEKLKDQEGNSKAG